MGLWLAGIAAFLVLGGAQAALASHLTIAGTAPDLLLAGVMVWALRAGPLWGGLGGLMAGLGLDLSTGGHLGLFALGGTLAGWLCGEASLRVDLERGWMRALVASGAAVLYGGVVVAGAHWILRLDLDAHAVLRHVLVAGVYDGVLAACGYWPILLATHNPLPLGTRPLTYWRPPSRNRRPAGRPR